MQIIGEEKETMQCLPSQTVAIDRWLTAMWPPSGFAGLDAIFGAFLVGVILPRDEGLVHVSRSPTLSLTAIDGHILVPSDFSYTIALTRIGHVSV